jgi:hypothetical protein
MNLSKTSLAFASIVVAVGLTGVAFSLPQQALAHYGHHHNNHSNSIKVDQEVNQQGPNVFPPSLLAVKTGSKNPSFICRPSNGYTFQ